MTLGRFVASTVLAAIAGLIFYLPSFAQDAVISATVVPQTIAVSVNPTSVVYGSLAFGDSKQTATAFVATNTGSLAEDFDLIGTNATSGATTWTLIPDSLSAINTYRHSVTGVTGGTGVSIPEQNVVTSQQTWANKSGTGYAAGDTQSFKTKIYMPIAGSSGLGLTMSMSITIVARAH